MSHFIEEFYYGNIEPQESITELKAEIMKKLNALSQTEEQHDYERHIVDVSCRG